MAVNYESMLFKLADSIRGSSSSVDFRTVITSALVLRWYELKSKKLIDRDRYDFTSILHNVIDEIEEEYYPLQGVLKALVLDNHRLRDNKYNVLLEMLERIGSFVEKEDEIITLINMLLTETDIGNDNFLTPKSIKQIMTKLVKLSDNDSVADYFMGYGGIGLSLKQANQGYDFSYCGEEINRNTYLLSRILMFINGMYNIDIKNKDAYDLSNVKQNSFDYVLMDAPFSLNKALDHNRVFEYGLPSKVAADWGNYQIGLYSLKDTGKAIVTAASGALFRSSDHGIRKAIVNLDMIEAVVLLPVSLYAETSIQTALIVFNKNKSNQRQKKIMFVDASNEYERLNRRQNTIPDVGIDKILSCLQEHKEIEGFSTLTDTDFVADNEYNLNPSVYINAKVIEESLGKTIQLKEVAEVLPGVQVSKSDFETLRRNPTHYYLNIKNIQEEGIVYDDEERIRDKKVNWYGKYDIKAGDIILTSKGTTSRAVIVPDDFKESFISNNLTIIRVNSSKYDQYVLKKYLESEIGRLVLENVTTGTTIKVINASKLETIEVPDYDLETIQTIGARIKKNEQTYYQKIREAKEDFEAQNQEIMKELKL
ncbi:N-6 DNA methylase [Alkaliphilus pronyensis]|uniref:site-specific DNA-methyltransferase (adenine-specific) n=1 Tax=Alkaliphilus pronyensis TaxID=1482732 RepID=A0A6I0F2N7_9FIRM|nr:N-6 DNA methylase [Alkaliphilus pronyensis]